MPQLNVTSSMPDYDFETEGRVVLSLLTAPDVFREGVRRMLAL